MESLQQLGRAALSASSALNKLRLVQTGTSGNAPQSPHLNDRKKLQNDCQCEGARRLRADLGLDERAGSEFVSIWLHGLGESWLREQERAQKGLPSVQLDYYRNVWRWRELSGLDGTDADSQRDLATSSEGRRKLGYPATVAPDVDLMDATQWARLGHWRKLGTRRLQDRPITQVYGPTEHGKYFVVERLSDIQAVMEGVARGEAQVDLEGFVLARTLWYEKILHQIQRETATPSCHHGSEGAEYPQFIYVMDMDCQLSLGVFWSTYRYWAAVVQLSELYNGVCDRTVLLHAGTAIRVAFAAVERFTTSDRLRILSDAQAMIDCGIAPSRAAIPTCIGGEFERVALSMPLC